MKLKTTAQVLAAVTVCSMMLTPVTHADNAVLVIDGSTQMYTLGALMAQQFMKENPGISIQVTPSSSQQGFTATCSGSEQIGMSDVYIQDNQLSEPRCGDMIGIPVAISATTAVYNLPGAYFHTYDPKVGDNFTLLHPVKLTPQIMAGIYSCTIKMWNDPVIKSLNPGMTLPAQRIRAFNSAEPGGSGFVFDQWLALSTPAWNKSVGVALLPAWPVRCSTGTVSSGAMVQAIASTPYSIGMVGFDYAISNKLQAAALENASGAFLSPSLNGLSTAINNELHNVGMPQDFRRSFVTVPGAGAFNPADFEFFLVHRNLLPFYNDQSIRRAIKIFLLWAIDSKHGQQFIEQIEYRKVGTANQKELAHGFVPVPPEIRAAIAQLVISIEV